jgi:hypothetical protein
MTELPTPTPCLRCGSDLPATATPRNELYFYTARVRIEHRARHDLLPVFESDVNQDPRGRLCDACTAAFVNWLKVAS